MRFAPVSFTKILATLVNRLGLAYDSLGLYFLLRIFIPDTDSILNLSKIVIIALVPIAVEMISETVTGENIFSFLGGCGGKETGRARCVRKALSLIPFWQERSEQSACRWRSSSGRRIASFSGGIDDNRQIVLRADPVDQY